MRIQLLGQPQVGTNPFPNDKRGYLLAYLAYVGDWVGRDRLAFLFWPDADERSARRNLRQLLNRVKRLPVTEGLELSPSQLCWRVETDVASFRQAIAAHHWAAAVKLYRGDLLEGFAGGASGFDAWLELERENLYNAYRDAVLHEAQLLEAEGHFDQASERLKGLLDGDELAEDVLQLYLRASYLAGKRDSALSAYERFAKQLRAELGLEPLEETNTLVDTIRAAESLASSTPKVSRPAVPLVVLRPPRLMGQTAAHTALQEATTPLVLVVGEPGIGKTRFLQEAVSQAVWSRCREGLQNVPYHPITAFIRDHLEHLPGLGPYLEDLARLLPEIAPGLVPAPLEPQTAKARLLEALARVKESLDVPIVIDDLQWADSATLEALMFMATRQKKSCCYGTYRAGEEGPALLAMLTALRAQKLVTEIQLPFLTETDLQNLLADLIGTVEGPPIFSHWLYARSGGNPLFALEVLKSLFESGFLQTGTGGWHTAIDELTHDYNEIEVPLAVSEVIARRVSSLSSETVRSLQTAAVMGEGFSVKLLSQVSGLSEWAVVGALAEAENAGLVAENRFKHDLSRQSIYRLLPEERRKHLHGSVAEALENAAEPAVVAEHWLAAGNVQSACSWWYKAAGVLRKRGLHEEAIKTLERAIHVAEHKAERQPLQSELAALYAEMSRLAEADALVQTLLAESATEEVRLGALLTAAVLWLYKRGRLERAEDVLAEAEVLTERVSNEALAYRFWRLKADILYFQGSYREGLQFCLDTLEREQKQPPSERKFKALHMAAVFYDALGKHEQALELYSQALALTEELDAKHLRVYPALDLLICYNELDQPEKGVQLAEETLALGSYLDSSWLRNNLATTYAKLKRFDEALKHSKMIVNSGDPNFTGVSLARMAEIYASTEQPLEMQAALEQALAHLFDSQVPAVQALTLIPLLRHGSAEVLERALAAAGRLDAEGIPIHIRNKLEQARAAHTK